MTIAKNYLQGALLDALVRIREGARAAGCSCNPDFIIAKDDETEIVQEIHLAHDADCTIDRGPVTPSEVH